MKYLLLIISVTLLMSCSKLLEEHPKSIAAENFYNTPAEVEAGLNAVYTPSLRGSGVFGALYECQIEIYAEYMYGRGSHAPLNDYKGLDNTNITRVGDMWAAFYQAIRNANIVIARTPKGSNLTQAQINKYVGEARFLRALWYFFLVRNWAGVPIRTENNSDSANLVRSTQQQVYDFIVQDLQFAEANLLDAPRAVGAPSIWSAKTVLADVYMQMKQYDKARDKALEVIDSKKFSLVNVAVANDFDKIFGPEANNTSEEIFYIKYSRTPSGQGFAYPQYTHYPNSGYYPPGGFYTFYSDAEKNPFIKAWDKNDLRYSFNWYVQTFGLGPTTILNKKFSDRTTTTAGGNDYPMYRYADVLMFYAESAAQAAGAPTVDGMEKLNMVHRRAYGKNPLVADPLTDFSLVTYPTLASFVNLVVRERAYENMGEAKHWFDLKRLGIAASTIQSVKGITMAEKHLLWPIPSIEYTYNKAIDPVKDQNPGY